jgi:selenocysteine lyase/cysteine desulfurase
MINPVDPPNPEIAIIIIPGTKWMYGPKSSGLA